jgi:regulator of sigma E protease
MIVSVMGAVFNLLFAVALSFIIWLFGLPTTDIQTTTRIGYVSETLEVKEGTVVTSPASYAGLREGDTITAIDGKNVDDWGSLLQTLVSGTGRDPYGQPKSVLTIERDGEIMEVEIYPLVSGDDNVRRIGITPAETLIVERTLENSPAALAGLKPGDILKAIDDQLFYSRYRLQDYLESNPDREIKFTINRNGESIDQYIRPAEIAINKEGDKVITIGAVFAYPRRIIHPTPPEQIKKTFVIMYRVLTGLINPQSDLGIGHMSGPPGIARILWETAHIDIRIVIWFTIIINVNLAIFNLLPIPVLDGGHMLFATIGKLSGGSLPANFVATAQSMFMILLFSLLIYVSFKDVGRWFRDNREVKEYRDNTVEPVFEKSGSPEPEE